MELERGGRGDAEFIQRSASKEGDEGDGRAERKVLAGDATKRQEGNSERSVSELWPQGADLRGKKARVGGKKPREPTDWSSLRGVRSCVPNDW